MANITIDELNYEEAKEYLGGVVFVAILMVVGFLGNLHVLIVYTFYMKPSNHRIFILVLGTLDLITCIVGMPFIIVDLRNPLTFTMSSACKILPFINYFICTASALTLIIIATDRYRKICVPFGKQITERVAKLLCCVVLFIALLLSWPAPVLYGIAHIETEANLTGTRCWSEDKPNFDKYQSYFNSMLILVVLITFITLVVLYVLIGRVISKHNTFKQKEKESRPVVTTTSSSHATTEFSSDLSDNKMSDLDSNRPETSNTGSTDCDTTNHANSNKYETREPVKQTKLPDKSNQNNTSQSKNFDRAKRTTLMFFLITVVFFLSYIPHLSLKIVVFMNKSFLPNASFAGKVVYHTVVWCFFVNNVANCFVYGFFDVRFRQEVRNMYRKLMFWK